MTHTLGFIGAGHMAEAIVRAAIDSGVVPADRIIASDRSAERRAVFAELGIETTDDNTKVIRESEQVLLAVKPQVMPEVAADFTRNMRDEQVVISIMAGLDSTKLEQTIGRETRIVRVMPNTPKMIGRGMAGVALGGHARPGDETLAMRLFTTANSEAVLVDESMIDAITAVSGSGPAYLFYLAEAMERAATDLGLADDARLLVAQTLHGAAELLVRSPDTAAELRRKVTSPGGTTEAAIRHLDSREVSDAIVDAIRTAERRAKELGA